MADTLISPLQPANNGYIAPVKSDPSQSSDYPVFGQNLNQNLPDPSVYSNAIGNAFQGIASSLQNSWGALASQNQPQAPAQAQVSPVSTPSQPAPMAQAAPPADPLSHENQVSWYGSPWMYSGAKQSQNQFQNKMSNWSALRPKSGF